MLTDLNGLFKDSMLHLGGDEIDLTCFDENPKINEYMQKMNISNYSELIVSHMAKVRKMLNNMNP
jgi:N-acetyl-beta-hexosaminidase